VIEEAVFAWCCFWCLEHDLEVLPGWSMRAVATAVGPKGQPHLSPVTRRWNRPSRERAVRFETDQIRLIPPACGRSGATSIPLDGGGQFCDRGASYRPAIFTSGKRQQEQGPSPAAADGQGKLDQKAAAIRGADPTAQQFWPAETYHQNYARPKQAQIQLLPLVMLDGDQRLIRSRAPKARTSVPGP